MNEAVEFKTTEQTSPKPEQTYVPASGEVQKHEQKVIDDLIRNTVQQKPVELKFPQEPR